MKKLGLTFVFAVCLGSGLAWARTLVTTPAGCHAEFSGGQVKTCEKCVKSGGKYILHVKNKGAWVCEK